MGRLRLSGMASVRLQVVADAASELSCSFALADRSSKKKEEEEEDEVEVVEGGGWRWRWWWGWYSAKCLLDTWLGLVRGPRPSSWAGGEP